MPVYRWWRSRTSEEGRLSGREGQAPQEGSKGGVCLGWSQYRLMSLDLILKIMKSDWMHERECFQFRLSDQPGLEDINLEATGRRDWRG